MSTSAADSGSAAATGAISGPSQAQKTTEMVKRSRSCTAQVFLIAGGGEDGGTAEMVLLKLCVIGDNDHAINNVIKKDISQVTSKVLWLLKECTDLDRIQGCILVHAGLSCCA